MVPSAVDKTGKHPRDLGASAGEPLGFVLVHGSSDGKPPQSSTLHSNTLLPVGLNLSSLFLLFF